MTIEEDLLDTATEPQKTAFARLVQRYACAPSHIYNAFSSRTLICEWPFITIGIEPDGYAHS